MFVPTTVTVTGVVAAVAATASVDDAVVADANPLTMLVMTVPLECHIGLATAEVGQTTMRSVSGPHPCPIGAWH